MFWDNPEETLSAAPAFFYSHDLPYGREEKDPEFRMHLFMRKLLQAKSLIPFFILLFVLVQSLLATPSTGAETAEAAASTYYLDGDNGSDENPGTVTLPWKSVNHAIDSIAPGDTVVIREGIYRESYIEFGPSGVGPDQKTTFKAAPGERVIFSADDDRPTNVWLCKTNMRFEGLWFGGQRQNSDEFIGCIRPGIEFIDNTFFGYREMSQGYSEYNIYQGNRFVRCGHNNLPDASNSHPIYLSGGYTDGKIGQHTIVDDNIFIAGEGHAIHGWHSWRSSIITRNFVAGHNWGMVVDGSDHLIANNFFWKQTGLWSQGWAPWGPSLEGEKALLFNNIMGPSAGVNPRTKANNSITNNAFLVAAAKGEQAIVLTPGNELNDLGITAAELDQTIAALEKAFTQPVAEIFTDTSIEPAFAKLKLTIPESSPLYRSGVDWFGYGSAINLGPDAPVPQDMDAFWDAFHSQGLCDWDNYGKKVFCGPDPNPTPEPTLEPTPEPTPEPTAVPTRDPDPGLDLELYLPFMIK